MSDVLTKAQRRLNMSRIKGKNTRPEKLLRGGLFRLGFRFRIHRRDLPGKPDIVLPKFNTCVFVHGCFWHGHKCSYFKLPQTRRTFWSAKIAANQKRDERSHEELLAMGWRVLIVWECALKSTNPTKLATLVDQCALFIKNSRSTEKASLQITG